MAVMDRSMEGKRQYTTGISKGVFFGEDGKAFPWNGLISVTEKPQANAPTPVYNSLGEKYDQFGNIAEKKHSLTCYTYPEEMDEFLGIEYLEEMGYSVDERPPKKFSMAYRTELGDGLYEIHVLLNQIATFADTAKNTITNNITPTVVTMNLEGVPDPRIKTSHIILDSRLPLTASAERLLFGNNLIDGNINEFLDAEPTWVTVNANYAPIIEPDYDNMVWLGGENLVGYSRTPYTLKEFNTSMFNYNFGDVYHIFRITPTSMPPAGSEIIATVSATLPPGRTTMRLYAQNDSSNEPVATLSPIGGGLYQAKTTMRAGEYQWFNLYGAASAPEQGNNPGDVYVEWVKIEMGPTPTPWTPTPGDNYVPPSDQPRPANYVPGVKYGSKWTSRARESLCFYDEQTGGLGVYSTSTRVWNDNQTSRAAIKTLPREELHGSSIRASMDVLIREPIPEPKSNVTGAFKVGTQGVVSTPPPNVRGTHALQVIEPNLNLTSNPDWLTLYHGGLVGSPAIVFVKPMVTTSNYTGEFFDINTTPPTRGDRYQRVATYEGDYTEHQQLVLQSKSRVILSDITQNQYTLEASDSQLRVDGQTFTFQGPQATPVGDDQFTINDEIYGED